MSTDRFLDRHLGPRPADIDRMLSALGVSSLDALLDEVIPQAIRFDRPLDIPAARSESESLRDLAAIASKNQVYRSYLGMGYSNTVTPPVILRNVLENPGWYTAYTPYQAEIAQGRLEALLIFQTMVQDLTGMEISNCSLLDEATAAAEAMTMAHRIHRGKRGDTFFAAADCHPQTLAVLKTRAAPLGIDVIVGDPLTFDFEQTPVYGALLQYPGTDGRALDYEDFCNRAHDAGALVTVAVDLLSLTLLRPPGAFGADIVVGNSQRFGVPLGYGGPHAAFLATREAYKRTVPGRIIGVSVDADGNRALRMALQTREQHIRRQKATSNICTAQVLLAVTAAMYGVYHGPDGITAIAKQIHSNARRLAAAATSAGLTVADGVYFDTIRLDTGDRTDAILERAAQKRINLRKLDDRTLTIALDETVSEADLVDLADVLGGALPNSIEGDAVIAGSLARSSAFMTHPFFHAYRSETEMMRYLHRLESRDLALNTSMIPLGSCTMKLNAAAEMIPITWAGFNGLHPYAPPEQARGYRELFDDLQAWLAEITGFDAVSLQPNAGSQGEYAGLLAIRNYHHSRGETHRDVCLIPTSAHGTNPASAVMAGMKVVAVKCDDQGNIDLDDLQAKAEKHAEKLAALMVTYPSTHGVFEEAIRQVCGIVHDNGGQVYMDGANMNAMVGLCRPADFGADVCHLNLHKTFCLAEGTPVTMADGTQRPIETLIPGQIVKAWSDEAEGVRPATLEGSYYTGEKDCVEITFEDGRTITCTADHRIRTTDGWVEAGDLASTHRVLAGIEGPSDHLGLMSRMRTPQDEVAREAMFLNDTSTASISGWKRWVGRAVEQLSQHPPILSPDFAGFQGNRILNWFNDHHPKGTSDTVPCATEAEAEAELEPVLHLGVVAVRPAGTRRVYDLTVADVHTFLANGVVVHNCIPHGGGGPGMGPIGVKAHLAPFLPGDPLASEGNVVGPVSAANHGSPSILPISWAYIAMSGPDGLEKASEIAILAANYLAHRLDAHFPVLYKGPHGRVAHECILDVRPMKDLAGITVDDIAKRLMDYGFHAPTMSWPVAGTLMIEPTESEALSELDRFCDAMIAIREEIQAVADGKMDATDNPLKNAPHTAQAVCADAWDHPYPRSQAAFPAKGGLSQKYWPTVRRIDNVYGDRNLACSCQDWLPAETFDND